MTTLEDNIDKARNYASETHEEIQNCLSLITIEGVKKFTPEDFLSTRDLSSQEISLRETRGRLWEVQWEEAEDLYEGEQYDPQAFKVRILAYLEKAYISSLPQRGEFKNQAQGIYQEALNYFHKQCQSAYISNPSLELIGRCALADSQYYRNACSSLYLYNFFKNLFPHPSLELISEYTAFKLAYEKFLMQFGDKFENPFKGYPW